MATKVNPLNSVQQVSREHDVSFTTIYKVLKKGKGHPFKVRLVQKLSDDYPDRRLKFIDEIFDG